MMTIPDFRISAPARIHMNLLSMGYDGYRKNGGVGFCVSDVDTIFDFSISGFNSISDYRVEPLSVSEVERLVSYLNVLSEKFSLHKKLSVSIVDGPRPHSGLGVGTTTRLALAEALLIANERAVTADEMVKVSGRGGTSGIGINTYFHGGFVLDLGVPMNDGPFGPSRVMEGAAFRTPQVLVKTSLPDDWSVGLLQTPSGEIISGERERDFFIRNTPIDRQAIEAACYQAVMGVAASVLDKDYSTFSKSIEAIQSLSWKSAEWGVQEEVVFTARNWLKDIGVDAVGLSSFGPALYFTHHFSSEELWDIPLGWKLKLVTPNNHGRVVANV